MEDLQSALDVGNHAQIAEAFTTGLLTSRSTVTLSVPRYFKEPRTGCRAVAAAGCTACSILCSSNRKVPLH